MYKSGLTQLIRWRLRTGIPRRAEVVGQLRLMRPTSDDFNFELANPGFNFGLFEAVCGCRRACVTCVARGSSPGATFDATSETDAHEHAQIGLIESETETRVCQSAMKIIRNWAHQS
jgi:hypothetical protein